MRIDGTRKDGTIDNKVTEELPLWVFAFPNPTETMCGDLKIGETWHKERRTPMSVAQSAKGKNARSQTTEAQ